MKNKGFTLIELLAVIVILGIVVAIAIPGINSVISNSRKKSVLAEAEILHSAALRKLASEPDFDFSIINKDNIKQYMETDGKDYDDVYISKVGEKIVVGLKKYGFRGKTDGKENIVSNIPPHIAYEFNFSYGAGFVDILESDLNNQKLYVYQGKYEDNISNISKGFKNPYTILENITPTTDLRTHLGYSGIYTIIATKMSRTSGKGYPGSGDWSRSQTALIGIPHFDIKELGVKRLTYLFVKANNFNQNINHWDTSDITDMRGLFMGATSFNQPLDNWDTSKVTDMYYLFWGASSFNQNINTWNTKNVLRFGEMFHSAFSYNQPLNNLDVSSSYEFRHMFYNAYNFNQPLNNWDTSNALYMKGMFQGTTEFNQDISNWSTTKAIDFDAMFLDAIAFNQDLSKWDVRNFPSKPIYFDGGTISWTKPQPIWGTNGGN